MQHQLQAMVQRMVSMLDLIWKRTIMDRRRIRISSLLSNNHSNGDQDNHQDQAEVKDSRSITVAIA